MSHIVRVQTQVRDAAAVSAACRRRELPEPLAGKHKVFQSEVEGLAVRLRGYYLENLTVAETSRNLLRIFGETSRAVRA